MATIVDTEKLRLEIEADRKELERRIAELKNELEPPILEKEAAYRYLNGLPNNPFIQKSSASSSTLSLIAEIKANLFALTGGEFTNADVEAVLGKKDIRPRITNELNKLVDDGILECTHKGSGRTPSRFKVKQA